ncbi:PHD finger protein 21A BHC80a BRAF35-HDAC complex protein BHC80 [Triplophysa tibetana]|uniref:PHD finger protein 21A BHC80a BRAF35-HDAC complex protein BHC80 n=1 Tax=Triplophysa tibetana TaxID=1572043 RepID=A0A5A9PRR9_9TELE|nr:PHD finger protein 21A BHC80a BRAF35-HDAC complex protein BHC80 [Triplophysa tibetana]
MREKCFLPSPLVFQLQPPPPRSASWMVFKTADAGKAAVLGFGKKGSMMELQNLQEALKVEIQIHQKLVTQMKQDPQNAELKLQLRDLQAKITALSERQKKVVEQLRRDLLVKQDDVKLQTQMLQADGQTSTLLITQTQPSLPAAILTTTQNSVAPVIASKTLPLVLRAATTTSPIIMTPAPTITVVTTLGNTLLASAPSTDSLNSPVNFQPVLQTTHQGAEPMRVMPNSTIVVQAVSQPIKVPQFVPPTRQTTRTATLLQVRPKPPASLSSAAGQVSVQTLQSPVLLSTALPSSGHVQQMRILNGLPCHNNTGILICPSTHTQQPTQTNTQQLHNSPSSDNMIPVVEYATEPKTSLLIPPDTPTHTLPPPSVDAPPAPTNTTSTKHQDNPLKLAFMLSLGLVTRDYLEEIQSRRQERKRRTTANPIYSGATFEPERKKNSMSYLSSINQSSRKLGRPSKNCSIVEWGPLPPTTSSHHSAFTDLQRPTRGSPFSPALSLTLPSHSPSLSPISAGDILQKEDAIEWPGTLAIVHSYISYKAAKEGEKDRLVRWSTELRQERETLEHRAGQLSNSLTSCMDSKNSVLTKQREMESSLGKIRGLVRLIRGIQLCPLSYPEFISSVVVANGDMYHNGASKPSSSNAVTTDTNNNTNNTTSSSEATVMISTHTSASDTLNQIATNNNTVKADTSNTKGITSSKGTEDSTQIKSVARIKGEPTNGTAFSNNSSNQGVPSTNGTVSAGEENIKKHKNNSDLGVIPQALLGPIVPLTEVTEGIK